MKFKKTHIGIILGLIVFLAVGIFIGSKFFGKEEKVVVQEETTSNAFLDKMPMIGDKSAKTTFIEFMDFKSQSSKLWAENVYPGLKKEFLDTGKGKLYIVNLAYIDEESMLAASAAKNIYEQDPKSFSTFYEELFKEQKVGETEKWITKDLLETISKKSSSKLDSVKFFESMEMNAYGELVQEVDKYANEAGVSGVPTVLVNGEKLLNSSDLNEIRDMANGDTSKTAKINNVVQTAPRIGNESAPITMFQFIDYKCPFCKKWDLEVFPDLQKQYIDSGKVKMYVLPLAFLGNDSLTGAIAAQTVYEKQPQSFAKFHDSMYKNQGEESKEWITTKLVEKVLNEDGIKMDSNLIEGNVNSKSYFDMIQKYTDFATYMGVSGTPTIFIDGQKVSDPFNYEAIKKTINAKISQ